MYNKNRYSGSIRVGASAVSMFDNIATEKGYKITPATQRQDRIQHFDRILQKNGKQFRVQVKAAKKKNRRDADVDYSNVWVQFQCCGGGKGWLHGNAEYIALQLAQSFLMIKRPQLLRIANKFIKSDQPIVFETKDAVNRLYLRIQKNDLNGVPLSEVTKKVLAKQKQFMRYHNGLISIILLQDIQKQVEIGVNAFYWPK